MSYTYFTIIEQEKLEAYFILNFSCRKIANLMGRHYSTIARGLQRNKDNYNSIIAQNNYDKKRKATLGKTKLSRDITIIIEEKLQCTWSLEQIANIVLHKKNKL